MTGLIPVLRAGVSGRNDLDPALVDPASVRWAVHAGLGPLICHISRNHLSRIADAASQDLLRSTDMVAQLTMSDALDALEEMLAASADIAREIILLKGISTCQYLYPIPHLRTMGDIDLLLPVHRQQRIETLLFDLGYRQQSNRSAGYYETHHHSMPFFHPARQIWVEVHTALFSNANAASDPVFSPSHVWSQTVPITFRGNETNRLNPEQEMIYIATHWALERKCFAGGALPFVDLAFLIRQHGHALDWENVCGRLRGSRAATYLYLMLRFLERHEVVSIPASVMRQLSVVLQYSLGRNETILHGMIERYSMRGTPFGKVTTEANLGIIWDTLLTPQAAWKNVLGVPGNILFPPGQPRRFNLAFQFARLAGALGFRKPRLS
jgi:hypothetical protein